MINIREKSRYLRIEPGHTIHFTNKDIRKIKDTTFIKKIIESFRAKFRKVYVSIYVPRTINLKNYNISGDHLIVLDDAIPYYIKSIDMPLFYISGAEPISGHAPVYKLYDITSILAMYKEK